MSYRGYVPLSVCVLRRGKGLIPGGRRGVTSSHLSLERLAAAARTALPDPGDILISLCDLCWCLSIVMAMERKEPVIFAEHTMPGEP